MKKEEFKYEIEKILNARNKTDQDIYVELLYDKIFNKEDSFEEEVIEAFKGVFEEYSELIAIPIYSWGRFYKYECAGESFNCGIENGFTGFKSQLKSNKMFDWNLLKEIDDKHNVRHGKLWELVWGDIYIDRDYCVNKYNFDDRGGKCLVIVKNGDSFELKAIDCDSPE